MTECALGPIHPVHGEYSVPIADFVVNHVESNIIYAGTRNLKDTFYILVRPTVSLRTAETPS